jgi:hypothetical protein
LFSLRPDIIFFSIGKEIRFMQSAKMDRSQIVIAKNGELDRRDAEYWSRAPVEEKLQTITYLRECFYGDEATAGRLQRFHTMLKLK